MRKTLEGFSGRHGYPTAGGEKGHGFTISDTHAVHCLRRWVLEGKNINAYIPVLQAYLGHVSFSDTAYYLHLAADLFPDITQKLESAFGYVIPEGSGYYEAD